MSEYNSLIETLEKLENEVRLLKTKSAIKKMKDQIIEVNRKLRHIAYDNCDSLNAEHGGKKFEGVVEAVRNDHIIVSIKGFNGTLMIDKCKDIVSKSWYSDTCCVEYTKGQKVEVTLEFNVGNNYKGIPKAYCTAKTVSGGTVNNEQYDKLCNDKNKYAFFKYPDDKMTGLF